MEKEKAGKRKLILVAVIVLLLMVGITILLFPYVRKLADPEAREAFRTWVQGLGIRGVLLMFGLQVLQIVVAFISAEPFEILAGILYGGWGGLAICLAGCAFATVTVFLLTKHFGRPLLNRAFGEEKVNEFAFFNNAKRLETIVFILFLVPGTPKDLLTYIVALSPMRLSAFLPLSLLARIPSIVSSTFIGANLMQGDWVQAVIIFGVTAVIGLLGIRYRDRIMDAMKKLGSKPRDP